MARPALGWCILCSLTCAACRDLASFTTSGQSYEGSVVTDAFVRAGIDSTTRLCLTLDMAHVQDGPGALSTSDGRFRAVALRPIREVWYDPLSTLSFGEGRLRNLIYVVTASTSYEDGRGDDVLAIVSLMQSGRVEVRLLRGAPSFVPDAGVHGNVFGVFDLSRQGAPCSY